jgi:hypothetical protein
MGKKTNREIVKVTGDDFGDFTGYGPWEVNGEVYEKVTEINTSHMSDGESRKVIVKRQSDGKFFKFDWWDAGSHNGYIFCDGGEGLEEVFPKVITTTIYE